MREQLIYLLQEQIEFIERSCRAYDEGHLAEAKRIAVSIRVLMHQTGNSHALINQLQLEGVLTWVDTSGCPIPDNEATFWGLAKLTKESGKDPVYLPGLSAAGPHIRTKSGETTPFGTRIAFGDWWTNPVIKDAQGEEFSRKDLMHALANWEGGAHVDTATRPDYARYESLAEGNSLGWAIRDAGSLRPVNSNPAFPSMRQMAYEVNESLRQQESLLDRA